MVTVLCETSHAAARCRQFARLEDPVSRPVAVAKPVKRGCMAGLAIGKGGWQLFHNPEGQQDLPSQVFHHFAPGPFLRRSTYISHNGSIAWSSVEVC